MTIIFKNEGLLIRIRNIGFKVFVLVGQEPGELLADGLVPVGLHPPRHGHHPLQHARLHQSVYGRRAVSSTSATGMQAVTWIRIAKKVPKNLNVLYYEVQFV